MATRFKGKDAARNPLLVLVLPGAILNTAAVAADLPTQATQPGRTTKIEKLDELSPVTISAEKPTREVADLIPFLRRILGQYSVDGKVDLGGQGKPEERWTALGSGYCVGFGIAPGVQCEFNIRWPAVPGPNPEDAMSGITAMTPVMILYGLDTDEIGIRYLQVNSKGLAESATGTMVNDTVTFKAPCANAAADCQRTTRITARSDSQIVDMQIDTEINYSLAARFDFRLRRTANLQTEQK